MSEIWVWTWTESDRTGGAEQPRPDVTGYSVEATDGHIGEIDEASFDEEARGCIVVDTGFWIFGKKRMIPAGLIGDVDWDEKKVFLTCTKDQVKDAPDYDEARREDAGQRQEVGDYFDRSRYRGMHGDPVGPQAGPGRTD
jgi:hypothetical protein